MKILLQGDSHIAYINHAATHGMLPTQHSYVLQKVNAATAQGLANPNSKTHALPEFRKRLSTENPDCIITQLGEVDCGFVIWYWAEKGIRTIEEQIELSINNYIGYLKEARLTAKHIIVTSPTLPTIKDGKFLDRYHTVANLRKEVKATQLERTVLTLKYDSILKQRCDEEGFTHVECTHDLLNDNGVIDDKYLHPNPHEHHLSNAIIAPVWATKLTPILGNIK